MSSYVPHFNRWLSFAVRLIRRLIGPHRSVLSAEARIRAQLSAVIALAFLLVQSPMLLPVAPLGSPPVSLTITVTAMCSSAAAYILSRTRWYRLGSWVLVTSSFITVCLVSINGQVPYQPMFFVLPIFLMSLFGSTLMTIGVSITALLIVSILHLRGMTPMDEVMFTQTFLFVISVFIIVSNAVRLYTEQKLLKRTRELAQREAYFRAVMEGNLDSFYLLEAIRDKQGQITDFRFIDVNDRGAAMVSMQREEVIGQLLCELLPVNRTGGFVDRYIRVVETGLPIEEEFPIQAEKLLANWLHHQVVPVGDGVAITSRNITQRKQAEFELRESEARHRALVTALPDLIFVLDNDGLFLDYHAQSVDTMMMPPEQFMGKSIYDVFPSELSIPVKYAVEQVKQAQSIQVIEYQLPAAPGMGDYEARIVAAGENRFLIMVRDVTEHKQLERKEVALKLEREKMTILSNFMRMASHEFRTPLAIISSGAYLLARTTEEDHRKERAGRMEEQVVHLAQLVDHLVMMTKLESGFYMQQQICELNILSRQIVAKAEAHTSKKSQQIVFEPAPQPLPLIADVSGLTIAITNILDNAINFTPEGGNIAMRICSEDDQVMIIISDDGMGIPQDAQPHIFERFYRVDKMHSTKGFGLGLSIAHKIIELHGGEIIVQSFLDKGSTFTIRLPIRNDEYQEERVRITQTHTLPLHD